MKVLIVGGGVIGLAIADALSQRNVHVTVVDSRSPGRGASQASAGILAPYSEAHEKSPLLPLAARSLDLFDDFVRDVAARSGRSIEYARTGTLDVALTDDVAARLQRERGWLATKGITSDWIDSSSLPSFEPSITPDARGGLFIDRHGFVAVGSLLTALVQSARNGGVIFEAPVEITHIESSNDGIEARAGDRRYRADGRRHRVRKLGGTITNSRRLAAARTSGSRSTSSLAMAGKIGAACARDLGT